MGCAAVNRKPFKRVGLDKVKYFLDTEFIERGSGYPIDLISLGIVAEDGREYYAISTEFKPRAASDWVIENVLKGLPPILFSNSGQEDLYARSDSRWSPEVITKNNDLPFSQLEEEGIAQWKPLIQIKEEVLAFVGEDTDPEFWGYYCSTDWVVFYQLWGRLIDKPKCIPFGCEDINSYRKFLGLSRKDWPKSLETDGNHNALLGAKTVKLRWEWCHARHRKETFMFNPCLKEA